MLANVRGALLIATSNRSEAAVGYATMDGDTAGGLSPIAGIDKPFLRRWLIQMERGELCGIPAIPALAKVNNQQPTAELRPSGSAQTDESDLMPYDALEAIEDSMIGERKSPPGALIALRAKFPSVDDATRIGWIKKFCRLWAINQWKRERYAPAFHIDDRNLDPKTWCRFPILSGGFSRELRDMEADARG
jgi:NAD+ synthase (glutamine-hydrolysing)